MMTQVVFDSLTGVMFSVVYGFNSSVKKAVGDCLKTLCCDKTKQDERKRSESLNSVESRNKLSKSLTHLDETLYTD